MTQDHPSLTQQIEAVEWAEKHAKAMAEAGNMMAAAIDELLQRLEAAVETLRTLNFMRDTLK